MPNESSELLADQKKQWREIFLNNFVDFFNDDTIQNKAIRDREGIKISKEQAATVNNSVNNLLANIDKNPTQYTIDSDRINNSLLAIGFTETDITQMPTSFKIMADAALFYAKSHNLLTSEDEKNVLTLGPIDNCYMPLLLRENPRGFMKDKKQFTNEDLPQLAKPLVHFQFTYQWIIKKVEELKSNQILSSWQQNLAQLNKSFVKKPFNKINFQSFNQQYQSFLEQAQKKINNISSTDDVIFIKEGDPVRSIIFSAITPRSGLELLKDTFNRNTANTKALGRTLLAIDQGTLTVNGQEPDENYPIGEYLIHGGRVNFNVSQLSAKEQNEFFQWITGNQAQQRSFATHRGGGTDASGNPAEIKPDLFGALWGVLVDAVRAVFKRSNHYGMNLAIGGHGIPNHEGISGHAEFPDESGEWGHMYLHQDKDLILIGIEASAPGKANKRTGEAHSKLGKSGELSAFMEPKVYDLNLHKKQSKLNQTPLSTTEKNNWATVTITGIQFQAMKKKDQKDDESQKYSRLVDNKPGKAKKTTLDRMKKMDAWAKATKEGNKTSLTARIMGGLLVISGILLAAIPIPVVAQVLGGSLVALGAGVTVGVIGAAVFAAGTYTSASKASELYNKSVSEMPIRQGSQDHSLSNKLYQLNITNQLRNRDKQILPSEQQKKEARDKKQETKDQEQQDSQRNPADPTNQSLIS